MRKARHHLCSLIVGFSLSLTSLSAARAENNLGAALFGIAIIDAMVKAAKPAKKSSKPARSAAEVQAAKDLQEALNYFGFDAGPVDGDPGKKTAAAVQSFQSSMGYPVTGQITTDERQFLQDARAWAAANPAQAQQIAAANPFGIRGLPAAYRDLSLGEPVPGATPAAAPATPPAQEMTVADDDLFEAPEAPARSITALCNQTKDFSNVNGPATPTNMPDPTLALNEQFCMARDFAILDSQQMASNVGASQQKITDTCAKLQASLGSAVGEYGSLTPDSVLHAMTAAITGKNLTSEKVQTSARICLGEGYRVDDAVMATTMAVALAATGRKSYGEAVGHHLREGLGVTANPTVSEGWLQMAIDASAAGEAPAFLPGQATERAAILSAALAQN